MGFAVLGRRQLVFAGIATDVGVALSAISALRAGYQVAVLVAVCGTISQRAKHPSFPLPIQRVYLFAADFLGHGCA